MRYRIKCDLGMGGGGEEGWCVGKGGVEGGVDGGV